MSRPKLFVAFFIAAGISCCMIWSNFRFIGNFHINNVINIPGRFQFSSTGHNASYNSAVIRNIQSDDRIWTSSQSRRTNSSARRKILDPTSTKNMPPKPLTPRRYKEDLVAFQRYKEYLAKREKPLPEQENAVIILTNHRSGSSFLGELFNQHPDVFYFFEPLRGFPARWDCYEYLHQQIKTLQEYVRCKMPDYYEIWKGMPPKDRNEGLRLCLQEKMCFRSRTWEMCEDKHCPRNSSRVDRCSNQCGTVNPGMVENDCRRKKIVAAKLVRFCNILGLKSIVDNTTMNIKVIHLLRDPRGIANSRHEVERELNLTASLNGTCQRQSHNLELGVKKTPQWLKGKYKVFRFEDVALFPYETARSVYDFIGLNFTDNMRKWIAENTGIKAPTSNTLNHHLDNDRNQPVHKTAGSMRNKTKDNPYGTKRNSRGVVQRWTKSLPYNTALEIEEVCSAVMNMAGYIKVGSWEQYKNDSRIYYTDKIPLLDGQD